MRYLFVYPIFLFRISLKNLFLPIYYNHLFNNLMYKFFLLPIEGLNSLFFISIYLVFNWIEYAIFLLTLINRFYIEQRSCF